jgi:nicotinamidase-related amidase
MPTYEKNITAVLCVDFYNDFMSEGGKLYPWIKDSAEAVGAFGNFRRIVDAARNAGITIFHVPQHRMEPGCFHDWKYPAPYQLLASENQVFAKGSWGGTFHSDFQVQPGDVICTEHWSSSGFPNTDLDHLLKRHGKEKLVCIGFMANTCLEATARFGSELGYHVTLVRDATAARYPEAMHAALNIDGPTYAHEILTTKELLAAFESTPAAV